MNKPINRKAFLRNSIILAGGLAFLPYLSSCSDPGEEASAELAELAETLIPKTNTPGAKDLGLQHFVIKMVEDCGDEDQQKVFGQGMVKFKSTFKDEYETDFIAADTVSRTAFLKQIEEEKFPELSEFYSLVKNLTIRGYTNSKFYMTEVVPYELVPGRYNPFFKIA